MFLLAIVRSRLGVGLVLGVVQLIVAGVLLTIHEHREGDSTTTLGVALAVWQGLAPLVIVTTAVTVWCCHVSIALCCRPAKAVY